MTITASLAPEPFWYIVNSIGEAAGGAKMYTRSSQNHEAEKLVYRDAGMTIPWDNPIDFGLNGVQGPFYWAFDDAFPDELYYIFVNDSDGNLLWDIDDFQGGSGGGGGGNITTYQPLVNLIANNQFIDHIDDVPSPTNTTNLVIAPSNHKGFTPSLINPVVGTNGVVGSDIRFLKNSLANADSISFETFSMASAPMNPSDVTPIEFVRYICTTGNPGESLKCFQFPITQKVKNLANQAMTFKVWARVEATPVNIQPYYRQYFGSNTSTASAEVKNPIGGAIALTTTWTQYNVNFVIDTVAAKTLGALADQTGDDALYIQLEMPHNTPCNVLFTKPKLYLGTINPSLDFETYDQINSIDSTPRTGDIKTSLLSSAPQGWVAMADNTIGNTGSGATRANKDTFGLFKTIWDGVTAANAPILTSGGVLTTRGATAVADYIANKRLTLPLSLGRALAGAGSGSGLTPRLLGANTGAETHTLNRTELPDPLTTSAQTVPTPGAVGGTAINSNTSYGTGTVSNFGGNQPHTIMQPTSFFNVFIKL